jgi:hypothetical protein
MRGNGARRVPGAGVARRGAPTAVWPPVVTRAIAAGR